MQTCVLLRCWYEGDSYLVDDSFVAVDEIDALLGLVPSGAEVFMPGEEVPNPDTARYGDPIRYRIALVETV